jgi:hypothetical protein
MIELSVHVEGCCVHLKGKKYGSLTGHKRQEMVRKFIEKGKSPAEFQKDMLADAHDDAFHSGNQANVLSRECAYSISAEAKNQKKKDIGLSKCKLENIWLSARKSQQLDLETRTDSSTDMLGIVRRCLMFPTVRWYLWTKSCAKIYSILVQSGTAVINADSTGGLVNIAVEGLAGKLLHTKISLSPKYTLLSGDETTNKSVARLLSPLTVAEMISSTNTGEE